MYLVVYVLRVFSIHLVLSASIQLISQVFAELPFLNNNLQMN